MGEALPEATAEVQDKLAGFLDELKNGEVFLVGYRGKTAVFAVEGDAVTVEVTKGIEALRPLEPVGPRPWLEPGTTAGEEIIGPYGAPMVWVPAGTFTMGSESGADDEKPPHDVRITKGFWVDKYEVTNELFAKFLNEHGKTLDDRGHNLSHLPDEHCGIVRRVQRRDHGRCDYGGAGPPFCNLGAMSAPQTQPTTVTIRACEP